MKTFCLSCRNEITFGGQPGTTPLGDDTVYEIAKTTDEMVKEQMEAEELVPDEIRPAINMQIDEEWQEREKPETKKKVESSEPHRILADKNLKLKFSTSNETLKGIGQTQCKPSVNWHLEQ